MIKKIKKNAYTEVYAFGKHICMSTHKARRVIDQIRGCSYEETLMILELMPYRACYPIFKLVYSVEVNASNNMGLNETNLVICKAEVNKSITVKKLKPRAPGRSYLIKRTTSYIIIVFKDTSSLNEKECKRSEYSILCSKKPRCINKYTNITFYTMDHNAGLWDKK